MRSYGVSVPMRNWLVEREGWLSGCGIAKTPPSLPCDRRECEGMGAESSMQHAEIASPRPACLCASDTPDAARNDGRSLLMFRHVL
jgi:hypothetical protein